MNDKVEKMEGSAGEIVLYQRDETIKIEVRLDVEHDTVWLNTMQMSQLFNREESNIRRHVGNIFREGELDKGNNVHFLHVIGVTVVLLTARWWRSSSMWMTVLFCCLTNGPLALRLRSL